MFYSLFLEIVGWYWFLKCHRLRVNPELSDAETFVRTSNSGKWFLGWILGSVVALMTSNFHVQNLILWIRYNIYNKWIFALDSEHEKFVVLDPVYTVPDPHRHDIILDSFYTNVALKFTIILQNLITANHIKNSESKHGRKLAEINVVTTWCRYMLHRTTGRTICICVWIYSCVSSHAIDWKTHLFRCPRFWEIRVYKRC